MYRFLGPARRIRPHFCKKHSSSKKVVSLTNRRLAICAMVQGAVKPSSRPKAAKPTHSKKQASRVTKPKKTKAAADKAHKKFTAGLTAKTEALLGERAGHLELIGKGKKADKKVTVKGGSKKFG